MWPTKSEGALMARKKHRGPLLGNHQKCWLWGRNLVLETLAAGRWPIFELHLADRLSPPELERAQQFTDERGIEVFVEPASRLTELAHAREHQGYLAKAGPYPYTGVDDILKNISAAPLYLILDSLQDPYNFGAVVRCAEVFGVTALFIGDRCQAEVSSMVARSSAGAVNRIPIARAADPVGLIAELQRRQVRVIGTSEKAVQPIYACDVSGPSALVIGNEGGGISPQIQAACDEFATIPLQGEIGSLNVAVAAGIVLYEASRQRTR